MELIIGVFGIMAVILLLLSLPFIFKGIAKLFPNWWKDNICTELDKDDKNF